MNMKRFALAAIAAFVFIYVFEWVYHGKLIVDQYATTPSLWRPEMSMQLMLLAQVLQALVLAFIFTRNFEGKGLPEGVRYGLFTGALLATADLGAYVFLPIPLSLGILWMVGSILKCIGVGVILSLVYKR